MIKLASLAVSTICLMASTALAADPVYETPVAAASYDWTGAYVGVQLGYGWADADFTGATPTEEFDGVSVGAHAGYNFQHGNVVFGVEGDINYTANENTYDVLGGSVDAGSDWGGSLRGRLGYALDRTLIYGTGGFAAVHGYVEGAGLDVSETMTGWTVGGGVEHAFTDQWTVRAEYRYSDYGSDDFGLGLGDIDITEHSARIGVSYKF